MIPAKLLVRTRPAARALCTKANTTRSTGDDNYSDLHWVATGFLGIGLMYTWNRSRLADRSSEDNHNETSQHLRWLIELHMKYMDWRNDNLEQRMDWSTKSLERRMDWHYKGLEYSIHSLTQRMDSLEQRTRENLTQRTKEILTQRVQDAKDQSLNEKVDALAKVYLSETPLVDNQVTVLEKSLDNTNIDHVDEKGATQDKTIATKPVDSASEHDDAAMQQPRKEHGLQE